MKYFLVICFAQASLFLGAQKVTSFSYSECDETLDYDRLINRISDQAYSAGTLILNFGTISDCAGMSYPQARLSHDTLMINYSFGTVNDTLDNGEVQMIEIVTFCDCYFESEYTITGLTAKPKVIMLQDKIIEYYPDKYKLHPVTFEIENGDTVNFTDKYGFAQGKWIQKFSHGGYSIGHRKDGEYLNLETVDYYANNQIRSMYQKDSLGRGFGTSYYENKNINNVLIETGGSNHNRISYYPNGSLRRISADNGINYHQKVGHFNDLDVSYYENGNIEKVTSYLLWMEYYEHGPLKAQRLYNKNPLHIWALYYYDNGSTMAIHYIKSEENNNKHWWEYYSLEGELVNKQYLENQGYEFLGDQPK